jgi:anti-sigma factor RsiW
MNKRHLAETDLALFASGDVTPWKYAAVCLHVARCEACRTRLDQYREGRQSLKQAAGEMPPGLDWDRLSAEMTANIRVGLAAGECVAPRRKKPAAFVGWKPVAAAAGVACVLSAAWWLNLPASDAESLGRSFKNIANSLVTGGHPTIPLVQNPAGVPEPPPQMAAQGASGPVSAPSNLTDASGTHDSTAPASPAQDYLTVTVAVGGKAPSTKIDLPKDKNAPVTLVSYDSGDTKATLRGSAYLVDFHPALSLRNIGSKHVHGVTLTILASEAAAGGKASLSVPGLDVAPGETFEVRINQSLISPASGHPSIQVQLDGVLFEDLSFYGPDKLQARHRMAAMELQARQDRKYFKAVLESSGPKALQTEMLESIARQGDVTPFSAQLTQGRSTNVGSGQGTFGKDVQFAFLHLPDTPVELSGGLARVSSGEADSPQFAVRNTSKRPVRHLEIGWILKSQDGREVFAGSLPADVNLAPGQFNQVMEAASLRFNGLGAIQSMRGFVSSAEFADGSYWIPSRTALDDPQLRGVVAPSPEEQRLTQIYNKRGLNALVEELKKFQ